MEENPTKSIHNHPETMNKMEERWFNWRSITAYMYLLICIFDFVAMPLVVQIDYMSTKNAAKELIATEEDKEFVIQVLDRIDVERWEPVTLYGSGLFHLAFGAIIGGIGVTKGLERREAVKSAKE